MNKFLLLGLFSIILVQTVLCTPAFSSYCDQLDFQGYIDAAFSCRQEEYQRNRQLELMEQQVQLQRQQVFQQQQWLDNTWPTPNQPIIPAIGIGGYY